MTKQKLMNQKAKNNLYFQPGGTDNKVSLFFFIVLLKGAFYMPRYSYSGPVMEFNTLLTDIWKGETTAPSERKARSNLAYQFKKMNNRIAGSKIILPGKLNIVD